MLADIDGLQVVGQAESGEESLIKARELKPDVVLMDVKMPGIGGLGATTKLLRSHPDIKVVVVTVCEEDPFPTRLLQAGAAGYLTKGAGLAEMVQAIRLGICRPALHQPADRAAVGDQVLPAHQRFAV